MQNVQQAEELVSQFDGRERKEGNYYYNSFLALILEIR